LSKPISTATQAAITAVDNATMSKSGGTFSGDIFRNAGNNVLRSFIYRSSGLNRWSLSTLGGGEPGANAGSDFALVRYDDLGASLGNAVQFARATGNATFQAGVIATTITGSGNASFGGTLSVTGNTTLSGTLGVTGAATLSSTLSVNGASTFASAVTINNTLAATGAVTLSSTLAVTGNISTSGNVTASQITGTTANISSAAGTAREVKLQTSGTDRWRMGASSVAESGSNAGSNFYIARYNDAGALVDSPFSVVRSTGQVLFTTTPSINGTSDFYTDTNANSKIAALGYVTSASIAGLGYVNAAGAVAAHVNQGGGAYGTYALLNNWNGASKSIGGTEAGSALRYSATNGSTVGGSPAGTWRCMGETRPNGTTDSTTLWIRIA
jgi:hypothetical protein